MEKGGIVKPGNRSARSRRRIEKARQRKRRACVAGLGRVAGAMMDLLEELGPPTAAELDRTIERDQQAEAEWKARAER